MAGGPREKGAIVRGFFIPNPGVAGGCIPGEGCDGTRVDGCDGLVPNDTGDAKADTVFGSGREDDGVDGADVDACVEPPAKTGFELNMTGVLKADTGCGALTAGGVDAWG